MKHSIAVGVLGALTVTPVIYAQSQAPASSFIAVSPNVNVLRGIDSLQGDKLLQRQNEPVAAVSTRNPSHIMVAANDYRAVEKGNDPGLGDALTRLARRFTSAAEKVVARVLGRRGFEDGDEELEKAEAGTEAWIGLYFSNDGGKSYSSHFMPGSPDDLSPISKSSPIFGRQAASDPVLASAPAGRFYLGAMAFDRDPITKEISFSQIVVSRFTDRNNSESGQNFHYDGMTLVDNGKVPARKFLDKPAIAADIHRSSSDPAACGPVYIAFTVFDQQERDEMERSKILLATSNDCGVSFGPPKKISHRSKLNQGVALAIRPSDGALFAVYRSFSEKKMFLVSSTDGGHSFTAARTISGPTPIRAFDQPTLGKDDNYSFRTNAFPSIAIDGHDNIFVAWQERLVDNGNPRIVITSSADGRVWTARHPIESVRCEPAAAGLSCSDNLIGPQVMPSLSFSRGRLMLLFYEARPGLDNVKWVALQQASFITGIDAELTVRAAQLDASGKGSSSLVTHYDTDKNGSVVPLIAIGKDGRQYRGINRPNLPMYAAGTSPFMGDYISLTPTMPFIPAGASQSDAVASSSGNGKTNGKDNGKDKKATAAPYWRWATEPTDAPTPAFVAVWGDNRDVVFPRSPLTGDAAIDGPWPQYSLGDGPCINPGSRNANVYAATMSTRLVAGTPTTFKPLDIQRAFVLFVQNQTADRKFYRLTILDSPPAVNASFVQVGSDQNVLDVEVFQLSTATQNVFATAQRMTSSQAFAVTVAEITAQGGTIVPGGDTATVLFNSDRSNPQLAVTDLTSERHSPRIFNPDNPSKTTPRISNPQVSNPQVSNPQVSNPQVSNPQVSNPQVSNPQVSNLQLTNSPLADPATPVYSNVTNYTWQVANVGDTTSAFAPIFNIANEAVRRNNTFTLYIYKTYRTPTFVMTPNGCRVVEAPHDEIISVVENPQVSNPQVSNPQVSNPQVSNPQVSNSTFFVAPSDSAGSGVGTTAARRSGALTLAAFQSPAPTAGDLTTLAAADAPTYITLSVRSGDPDVIEAPPPPPDDHSPPPAVRPPLSADDFSTGGSAVAVTATANDVIQGVTQAVPEAATTGADLVISTPPTISVSPNAVVPAGTVVTFGSFTVQNIGQQATSGPFKYGFYLSPTSQIDPKFATLLGSATFTPTIDAGATAVLSGGTFTIPPGALPADYFLGVRINSGDPEATPPDPKLFEPEFNDSFTIPIHVVPGANLAIVQGALAPSTLFAGQTTTAAVTVENVGTAPAAPSSTAFFLSADAVLSGNDTLLGAVQTPALAPGSSAVVLAPLVIPANTAVGAHSVIASADATNAVPESNEFDNAFALSLRVVNTPGTLTFQQQPSAGVAGHAIAPAAQVGVTTQGTAVAGALVQMALVAVPGTAALAGTTAAVSDAAGIATFTNLIVSEAGTYRLSASAPTLGSTPSVLSSQFTVTANHAPTANPDAYAITQGTSLTVPAPGVLGNDSDADGDPLTAVLVSGPPNGQLTLNAGGSFSYTPSPAFSGSDSFVYAASDGITQSATATVTITVAAANRAPIARDDTATTTAGVAVAANVLLNDTDADGDTLVVTETGTPAHGTALLTSPGIITYMPRSGFSGTDSFSYTVSDGRATSTATVTVMVTSGSCSSPTFYGPTVFPIGSSGTGLMASGDFNHDGHVDVAVTESATNQVAVLLGDGTGGFGLPRHFDVGSNPQGIVAADFNKDGAIDLAVVNNGSATISILLGDGAGGFSAATNFAVPAQPFTNAVGDLNGDGHLDLVIGYASVSISNIAVLLGDGAGRFGAAAIYPSGQAPLNVIVGDFDGDGHPDVAVPNVGTNNVAILRGDGAGGFAAPTTIALPNTVNRLRYLGDVNGDGRPDLGATTFTAADGVNLMLLLNDGTGGFTAPVEIIHGSFSVGFAAPGDFNGDGKTDLAAISFATNSLLVLLGDGAGRFGAPASYVIGDAQNHFMVADLTGDGKPDLVGTTSGAVYSLIDRCGTATIADLSITASPSADHITAGDTVTVAWTITNQGPDAATGVAFTTTTNSSGFELLALTTPQGSCVDGRCSVGTLAVNASATLTATVRVFGAGARITRAMVTGAEADPNENDNTAILTITVDAAPVTFAVSNTNDSGAGSLRQAILGSNNNTGQTNHIVFSIPDPGPFTVTPLSALPTITVPVVIDGTTQSGFAGTPVIELSGVKAANAGGLSISAGGSTVRGLVINGFTGRGISINSTAPGNSVIGNFIGTDASGTIARGNGSSGAAGIGIDSSNNTVERNLISGGLGLGVNVLSTAATGNIIRGNFIGTDVTGTTALPNRFGGISINGSGNTVGGVSEPDRNIISGNTGTGVSLSGANNVVQGNFIGATAGGSAIPNTGNGVYIDSGVANVIGGEGPGGNVSAFNTGTGVFVNSGINNAIRGNSIHHNGGLGIDLAPGGVTLNDTGGDPDVGANNLQNFPLLTQAVVVGATTTVAGTFSSAPDTTFAIDVFANAACDPSGYGEGERYVGSLFLTTDGSGNGTFQSTFSGIATGEFLTATATDPAGNTSEFARCRLVVNTPTVVGPPIVTTTALPNAFLGAPYSQQLTVGGATGAVTWSLNTNADLRLSWLSISTDGVLNGTPPLYGTTPVFTVQATDSIGQIASRTLSIFVDANLDVVSTRLREGVVFEGQPPIPIIGGQGSRSVALLSGSLPPGLVLTPTGAFTGAPSTHGSFEFTVSIADCTPSTTCAAGTIQQTVARTLSLRVSAMEQQSFGTIGATSFDFGGSTGRRVAQVFTVGANGLLTAVRLNQLLCPAGAAIRVGIERVTNGAPDGTEIAFGTGPGAFDPVRLDTPIAVAIDQQLALVVSSSSVCQMRNLAPFDSYNGGDAFILTSTTQRLKDVEGFYDFPFRTFIQPATAVVYLNRARSGRATATLLNSGKVLFIGPDNSAELYDPPTNSSALTGNTMTVDRFNHTATLLADGTVLVVGGRDSAGNHLASAEIYDPGTGQFTALSASLATGRESHTATRLADGRVLIAGGLIVSGPLVTAVVAAEIYDPATRTFGPAGDLVTARFAHTATPLLNGKILLAGGFTTSFGPPIRTAELYDPIAGTFTPTAGNMVVFRGQHTATLLDDGRALITGGAAGDLQASTEIYSPVTDAFTAARQMSIARTLHTATLLPDGSVLVTGGFESVGNASYVLPVATMERFVPDTGTFVPAGSMEARRQGHTATRLQNGKVLLTGGGSQSWMTTNSGEIFEAGAAPALTTTSLPDGEVGVPYSAVTLAATAGAGPPYHIDLVSGAPPNGIFYDSSSFTLSGTPRSMGNFTFGLRVTDAAAQTNVQSLTIRVNPLDITSPYRLPNAALNRPYTFQLTASSPAVWSLAPASSILPPGLSIASGGLISGTPTSLGGFTFAVIATDASGRTTLKTLNIFVNNPLRITTTTVNDGVLFEFYGGCLQASAGNGQRTWSVTAGSLPPGVTLQTNGCFSGQVGAFGIFTFTAQVTDQSTPPQTSAQALMISVSLVGDQGAGFDPAQPALPFGGSGFKIAERVFTGVSGQLRAVRLGGNSVCPTGTIITAEIQGVTPGGAPDGITRVTGSARYPFNDIPLGAGAYFAADQRFTIVFSADAPCAVRPTAFDSYVGEGYVLNAAWLRLRDFDGRYDIPFQTLIEPDARLQFMTASRGGHTATTLLDGRVLLTGNDRNAEIYDPVTDTFTRTGDMSTPRVNHTGVLLADGTVLIAGGRDFSNAYLATAELFHPDSGQFELLTSRMSSARAAHTATRLPGGQVLILGGAFADGPGGELDSAELYDPAARSFAQAGTMTGSRLEHTATLLPDGRVFIAGGFGFGFASAEFFDPVTMSFTRLATRMPPRGGHTATLLPDGTVLLAGGGGDFGQARADADLFDPAAGTFTPAGPMTTFRIYHAAALLADGSVLVAGGLFDNICCDHHPPQASMERWVRGAGFVGAGSMAAARDQHQMTPLPNGTVLITGGFGWSLAGGHSAEKFDASTIPAIANPLLPDGHNGTSYPPVTLIGTAGVGPYAITLVSGALPSGMTYESATSTLSGTPAQSGTFTLGFRISDAAGHSTTQTLALRIDAVAITSSSLPTAFTGVPYNAPVGVTGVAPISISVTQGSLPPGLSLSGTAIVGTPTALGFYNFTLQATDQIGQVARRNLGISVQQPLTITTTALPDAGLFDFYGWCLFSSGGIGARTWSLASGSGPLPKGVTLQSYGCFTGTAQSVGTFDIIVEATDSTSPPEIATKPLSITILAHDQEVGGPNTANQISFGASTGRSLAQTVTAGTHGLLTSVNAWNMTCPPGASLSVEIQGVTATDVRPNGTVLATGTGFWYAPIRVSPQPEFGKDEVFAIVFSSTSDCTLDSVSPAERYWRGGAFERVGTSTWERRTDLADIPFRTLITPQANLTYLSPSWRSPLTATLLNTGRVLLVGGGDNTTDLYDVATATAEPTGSMAGPRSDHTATLLNDGTVLVAGGRDSAGRALSTAEIYDPAPGTFTPTSGTLSSARTQHTATLLADGRVLLAGGFNESGGLASVELYDPATRTFAVVGTMLGSRWIHTATRLTDGRVLFVGGATNGPFPVPNGEVYDPTSNSSTPTGEPITFLRARHTATLLSDGRVLIAGGTRFYPQLEPVVEFYDPATNRLVSGPTMLFPRADFTATRLINPIGAGSDEIAMIGGVQSDEPGNEPISQVEVFSEALSAFFPAGSLAVDRARHGAVPVGVRRVLVAGGSSSGWLASHTTEVWDERFNIVPPVLPDGHTGIDYSQVLEANGGRAPFTVSVITGGVPPGLTVTPISGFGQYRLQIAGTPTASGSYTFSVNATDVIGSITQGYTIRIDPATIVTTTLANAAVGTAYDQTLSATGVGAVTWDVVPGSPPPPWLTLTSAGHLIAANPPSSGFFFFTVRATDSVGQTATRSLGLFVESPLVITTKALGDAVAPWWYGWCFSWEGGHFPAHFSVSHGALPYGLTLQDYGCFTGNALQTGTFQFDVTANDGAQQATKTFTLRSGTADQAQFSIDQSMPPSTIPFGGATAVAQVFTTAMHGSLIDVEIPVSCSDAGLRLEIRGVTAGRPNTTVLAFEDFSAADVAPFQFGPYHRQLRLTTPIFLAKGTQAAAVVASTGSCSIYLGAANQTYQFGDAFVGVAENWTAIQSFDPTRPDIPFHAIVDDGGRLLFETNGRSETVGVPLTTGPNAGAVLFAAGSGNSSTLFNATDHSLNGLPSHRFGFEALAVEHRRRHTLTTLSDGRVLAVGGWNDQQQTPAGRLEMYDPAANAWTTVGSLNTARFNHAATLIAGDRVLIAGGQTQWGGAPLSSTEIFVYDGNGAGHLVAGPVLNDARAEFTAVSLPNGQAAMIGGWGSFITPGIELYTTDAGIGSFARDIQLQVPRSRHATIVLACPVASPCAYGGNVLILGGWLSNQFGNAVEAELYDPLTHTSTKVGAMMEERAGSAAVQLNDGRVIAAGGDQHSGATLSSIEIYEPTTAAFHAAGEMTVPRGGIAAAHLSDDSALFVGGFGASAASWSSAELFAPDRLLLLGRLNTAYASSIPARGTSPFAFTLKAGALPPGVELDASTGALRGTPTQAGLFTFVVAIADASTPSRQTLFDGTIQVGEAPASRALNIVEAGVAFIDRSTATLTVQLEESEAPAAAPAGGFDVLLASSNPACVSVQTTATIPAGQSAVAVTVAPGGTAPLPCTSVVTVSGTQAAGDLVNVTVTPPTAPRPNPTGPGTTMVSFFNPAPVVGGPQRQQGIFASVSYSSPISGQQTPVVTRASTTSVSFFNPAATAQPTPAMRNSLTMLSYFNPAPVFTAVQRQVATFASVSFFNPAPISQPTAPAAVRSGMTTLSFFNPAPIQQATVSATMRSSLTTLSFFNPAPIQQPTVAATMRSGLTTLSFFNPAPLPTTQTVRAGAAAAPAVSFANGASSVGGAGTIALRAGGTLDALRFAAGPTITEISPAVLSLSAPVPTLVITGANLFGVTDVTFSDPTGITIGAISASPDGRTLSIPIALAPTTPLATIAVVVTGATGSSPITDQTVVTIVP